jgi:hypothetical protein
MSEITVDRALLEQALEALTNCSSEYGHRCSRCDSEIDEGGKVAAALRAALEQDWNPLPLLEATQSSLREHMAEIRRLRALLDQALEALVVAWQQNPHWQITEAITAIRAALEQGPMLQSDINWLRARPYIEQFIAGVGYDMTLTHENVFFKSREKVDVRQEQEPVAWMVTDKDGRHFIFRINKPVISEGETLAPLYTHPPRREQQRDELLEALRQIAKIGNQPYGTDYEEIDKAREIARAAIAKVEGTK